MEPTCQPRSARGERTVDESAPLVCNAILIPLSRDLTRASLRATRSIWSSGVAIIRSSFDGNLLNCVKANSLTGASNMIAAFRAPRRLRATKASMRYPVFLKAIARAVPSLPEPTIESPGFGFSLAFEGGMPGRRRILFGNHDVD